MLPLQGRLHPRILSSASLPPLLFLHLRAPPPSLPPQCPSLSKLHPPPVTLSSQASLPPPSFLSPVSLPSSHTLPPSCLTSVPSSYCPSSRVPSSLNCPFFQCLSIPLLQSLPPTVTFLPAGVSPSMVPSSPKAPPPSSVSQSSAYISSCVGPSNLSHSFKC